MKTWIKYLLFFLVLLVSGKILTDESEKLTQYCNSLDNIEKKLMCLANNRDRIIRNFEIKKIENSCNKIINPKEKINCLVVTISDFCSQFKSKKKKDTCFLLSNSTYPQFGAGCLKQKNPKQLQNCLLKSRVLQTNWTLIHQNFWAKEEVCKKFKIPYYVKKCRMNVRKRFIRNRYFVLKENQCFESASVGVIDSCLNVYRKAKASQKALDKLKSIDSQCSMVGKEQIICEDGSIFQLSNQVSPDQLIEIYKSGKAFDGDRGG